MSKVICAPYFRAPLLTADPKLHENPKQYGNLFVFPILNSYLRFFI